MAGKRQKVTDTLQDRRPQRTVGRDIAISRPSARPIPITPAGLRKVAKDAWVEFWQSPMSSLVQDDSDMDALRDWAWLMSERDRLQPMVKKEPLVLGSTGQLVVNPISKLVADYTRRITQYRDQFGMTPLSRMRLGIAVGEAADTLASLSMSAGSDEPETFDLDAFGSGEMIEVGS